MDGWGNIAQFCLRESMGAGMNWDFLEGLGQEERVSIDRLTKGEFKFQVESERIEKGFAQGDWAEAKMREVQAHRSWEMQTWGLCIDISEGTFLNVQMTVRVYNVRPGIFLARTS